MKLNNQIAGSMGSYLHFRDMGWEPVLKGIADAGFRNVELSASHEWQSHIVVEEIAPKDIERLKDLLSKYNLRAISMSAHCALTNREGLDAFKRRMDLASELGVGILITGTGKWGGEEDLDTFYLNMEEVSTHAQKRDVLVTLETHGNGFTGESHTGSGKHYLPIIKHINRENVRICYDTANVIFYEGVRPEEDIVYVENYLGYLHIKDKNLLRGVLNFPALGQGNVNFGRVFDVLRRVHYTGPSSVEIELSPPVPPNRLNIEDFNKAHEISYKFLQNYFSSL
jgi:sugar phosphate isomerase/epimerase